MPNQEQIGMDVDSSLKGDTIRSAVIAKVMPVFFERASKVVIQLVKDNLSKARLGDLETYADGEFRQNTCISAEISASHTSSPA